MHCAVAEASNNTERPPACMNQYFIQQDTNPHLDKKCVTSKLLPFILQLKCLSPKHALDILSQISITTYISHSQKIHITYKQE